MEQIEHRWAYLSHFVEELLREGAHPFSQGDQVDWLDHLVRGAFPVRDPDALETVFTGEFDKHCKLEDDTRIKLKKNTVSDCLWDCL